MSAPVIRELTDYDSVNNWMLGLSQSSKRPYLRHFTLFCEYAGRDPEKLIEWARSYKAKVHERAKQFFHRLAVRIVLACGYRVCLARRVYADYFHNQVALLILVVGTIC